MIKPASNMQESIALYKEAIKQKQQDIDNLIAELQSFEPSSIQERLELNNLKKKFKSLLRIEDNISQDLEDYKGIQALRTLTKEDIHE